MNLKTFFLYLLLTSFSLCLRNVLQSRTWHKISITLIIRFVYQHSFLFVNSIFFSNLCKLFSFWNVLSLFSMYLYQKCWLCFFSICEFQKCSKSWTLVQFKRNMSAILHENCMKKKKKNKMLGSSSKFFYGPGRNNYTSVFLFGH